MSLATYYQQIFAMAQHHKYSITEVESLYPFERDIYFELLVDYLKEEKNAHEGHT